MMPSFTEELEQRDWLLADGAIGTNLFEMGLSNGDAPEIWNETEPQKIKNLHRMFGDAGSELFLTNSFGANRARLKLHKLEEKSYKLSRISAALAKEVASEFKKKIFVAGSIGPTGEILSPIGDLKFDIAVEFFHEQAEGLKAGGADIIWVETISAAEEFYAAAKAIELVGLPWCGTMSFDTAGRTMMGISPQEFVKIIKDLENPPTAFGANCGTGAADIIKTLQGFTKEDFDIPLILKGNAGVPRFENGEFLYDGTPEVMAQYALLARDSGAKIIGGCCGTAYEHISAMKLALETTPLGNPPSDDLIVSKLGKFSENLNETIVKNTDRASSSRSRRKRRSAS